MFDRRSYEPSLGRMSLERNSKFLPLKKQGTNYKGGINFRNFEFIFEIISLKLDGRS